MAYIAPIHQPSAVRHALKLNLLDPEEESLVVAKSNRLEIYAQTSEGLTLRHTKSIYGRVTILDKLRPAASFTHHLFVGTDIYMYFTLSWDPTTNSFRTEKSYLDQADRSARDSQTGDRCNIDPQRRFLSLEVYEGVITIIPIAQKPGKNNEWEVGNLTEPIPFRIPEMFVRSSTFFDIRLRGKDNKAHLALLYEDTLKKVRLKIRPVTYTGGLRKDVGNIDLDEGAESLSHELELGASHLISIPPPACGMLIVGETSISYYEHSSGTYFQRPLKEATIFVAWEQIDKQRFVLSDEYGRLYLLMLELDNDDVVAGWRMDVIGETSKAAVLVYLDSGSVFVGSNQGDSQVINIRPQSMDVIQTLPNIGPILDFTIMDLGRGGEGQNAEYSSGQARLVTGSGAFKDGSLRSVRSGVGLEDLGAIGQVENVTDMFSLKSSAAQEQLDTLLVSFIDETRLFRFSPDGDVEELDSFAGCTLDQGTLLAANAPNGRILQVTASFACLTDLDGGMRVAEWTPPMGAITAVSANDETLVLSVAGSSLVALDLRSDLNVRSNRTFAAEDQVACVHVPPSNAPICVVGFWNSAAISFLDLSTMKDIRREDVALGSSSIPRSLTLLNLVTGQPPILLIAMADGTVITYSMDPKTYALSARSSITLGAQQATFRALPRYDDLYSVLAICEHPSLIYGSEGRIVYSAVTASDATCVCPFDSAAYPNAIAIATKSELKLAVVDEERSTHVQGLPVGETVRRVAYSSSLKAFGLGTIKRTLEEGAEVVQSHFKLADEVMFQELATYDLNDDELIESVMGCQLDDGSGRKAERFVLGTAYLDDDHADAIRGRIVVLEVTEDRALKVVTEHNVKGACRCLAMLGDNIVAGLIKTVVVYDLTWETASTPSLRKKASYRCSTAPIDISIHEPTRTIGVADLMKSLSLIRYTPGSGGTADSLTEIARHFQTTWATACAYLGDGGSPSTRSNMEDVQQPHPVLNGKAGKGKGAAAATQPTTQKEVDSLWLEADAEGNLLLLKRDTSSEFAEDRRRLNTVATFRLGELVNKIRPLPLPTSTPHPAKTPTTTAPGPTLQPTALLATTTGSIHLLSLIHPSHTDLLLRLQSALAPLVQSPGNVPFNQYRAFKNGVREEEEPVRWVDGELVEQFLELGTEAQESVCKGLGTVSEAVGGVRGVRDLVEGLRRMR